MSDDTIETNEIEALRRALATANTDALRVGDSPVRADRVYAQIQGIAARLPSLELGEEKSVRLAAALQSALRVLRRDEDGREAARHLQAGLRLLEGGSRAPSPFLDD